MAREAGSRKRAPGARTTGPVILVLTPTRELAQQVMRAARTYGARLRALRVASIVGGMPYGPQLQALRAGSELLVATPGRLWDFIERGAIDLSSVKHFILDEADRMLDMGFIDDIRKIAALLRPERQTLMFSATFGGAVGRLAQSLLKPDAQVIAISEKGPDRAAIEQRLHWADDLRHKDAMLDRILADADIDQAVVFTRTQIEADGLARRLFEEGHSVASLHGGLPQGMRNRVLQGLRQRRLRVLVATDVAARGIDVPTITHVVNYGLPMKAEDYVHRIGRTGRAGRAGLALTLAERRDIPAVHRVQQLMSQAIPVAEMPGLEPRFRPRPEQPRAKRSGPPHRKGGPGRFASSPGNNGTRGRPRAVGR